MKLECPLSLNFSCPPLDVSVETVEINVLTIRGDTVNRFAPNRPHPCPPYPVLLTLQQGSPTPPCLPTKSVPLLLTPPRNPKPSPSSPSVPYHPPPLSLILLVCFPNLSISTLPHTHTSWIPKTPLLLSLSSAIRLLFSSHPHTLDHSATHHIHYKPHTPEAVEKRMPFHRLSY